MSVARKNERRGKGRCEVEGTREAKSPYKSILFSDTRHTHECHIGTYITALMRHVVAHMPCDGLSDSSIVHVSY